jgi:hypothetical protein
MALDSPQTLFAPYSAKFHVVEICAKRAKQPNKIESNHDPCSFVAIGPRPRRVECGRDSTRYYSLRGLRVVQIQDAAFLFGGDFHDFGGVSPDYGAGAFVEWGGE